MTPATTTVPGGRAAAAVTRAREQTWSVCSPPTGAARLSAAASGSRRPPAAPAALPSGTPTAPFWLSVERTWPPRPPWSTSRAGSFPRLTPLRMKRSASSRRTRPSWTTSSGSSSASRVPCPARRSSCGCTARTPPRPAVTSSACTATTSSATWRRASRICGPVSSPSVWPPRGATSPPITPASSRGLGRRSNRRARRSSRRPRTSSPCSGPGPRRRCPWRTRPSWASSGSSR